MKFKTPQGGHVHRRLERDGLGHLCAKGYIEVPGDVFSKFFTDFSKRFEPAIAQLEAIVACHTHPNHAPAKPKEEVASESQPSPVKKSHDVPIWIWRIIVVLLLLGILLSGRAHAQNKPTPNIFTIGWLGNGITGTKSYAGPFKISLGTNLSGSVSGSTITLSASATAATAWSGITAATNANAGTFAMSGNTLDLTAATMVKLRVAGGLTTSANGDLGYDTTNKNWHIWANAVDNFVGIVPAGVTVVSGHIVTWSLVAGVLTLNDGGALPLSIANGGTGTASTLTGLVRGSAAAMTAAELSGDVTTSGSNVVTNVNLPDGVTQAGHLLATNIAAPVSPAAGKDKLFVDSTDLRFHDKNASGVIGTTVVADTGAANNYISAISAAGAITKSRPACATLSDASASCATDATNAANIGSGTLPAGRMPALTGAVTTSAGAVATSPGKIDVLDSSRFCQAAGASSTTYTCSLSPAITAYVTGTHYGFKADVANTAASTINFNAQGAKTIKKASGGITTDLAANDMQAGQWVDLVYDGTNMQMQSTLGNAPAGSGTVNSGTANHLAYYATSTAAVSSDATATDDGTTLTYSGTGGVSAPKYTATGAGAGDLELVQGSAPSFGSNAFDLFAPASITTSFGWKTPAAAATGIVRGDNSSNTVTLSQAELSGDCTTSGSNAVTCTKTSGTSFTGAATMTLPVSIANGGTGTASTLTGLMRGNASAMTAAELSGDATTSGSNAVTVAKVNGVAYGSSPATDTIPVITAALTETYKAVPDCTDATGNHLNYTASTHAFSCGTSDSHVGTVTSITGTANEIASTGGATPVISVAPTFDIHSKTSTAPVKAGTIVGAPGSCQANVELYIETDATAGQQLFICNAAGTGWTLLGDGGGGGGGNTTSTALTTNKLPKANGANSIIDSSVSDDGTTVTLPELAVISPIFNNVATLFTGLTENVTDTASQRNSLLADLQVGGSTRFKVEKAGTTTITGTPQPQQPGFIDVYGTPAFIGAPALSSTCRYWYDTATSSVRFTDSSGNSCGVTAGRVGVGGAVRSTNRLALYADHNTERPIRLTDTNASQYDTWELDNGYFINSNGLGWYNVTNNEIPFWMDHNNNVLMGMGTRDGIGDIGLVTQNRPNNVYAKAKVETKLLADPSTAGYKGSLTTAMVGDGRILYDAACSSSSSPTNATSATGAFTAADVGKVFAIAHGGTGGKLLSTTVSSVTNSTTIVMATSCVTTTSADWAVVGTDNSAAMKAQTDAMHDLTPSGLDPGGGLLKVGAGIYVMKTTWTPKSSQGWITVQGTGPSSTLFVFVPVCPCTSGNNNDRPFAIDYTSISTRRQIASGIAKGATTFTLSNSADGTDILVGEWLVIAEYDSLAGGGEPIAIDWVQVVSVATTTVTVKHPFRTAFSTSRTYSNSAPLAGLGFVRATRDVFQNVALKDFGIVQPDTGTAMPSVYIGYSIGSTVDNVWADNPNGQNFYCFRGKDVTFTRNRSGSSKISNEVAACVDVMMDNNVFGGFGSAVSNYQVASSSAFTVDDGTAFFSFTNNKLPESADIAIQATRGVHDGIIKDNQVGWVRDGGTGQGQAIVCQGCLKLTIEGNTFAGGDGTNTGVSLANTTALNVQINSSGNIVGVNTFGTFTNVYGTMLAADSYFTLIGTEYQIVPQPGTSGGVKLYDSGGVNAITDQTSGTITSYTNNKPLAAASGVQFGVNSSNTITQNFSGDSAHSLSQLAKTAAVTTFTLCAATAGTACGQAGQYRISYNFYGSGTACSSVTAGSVGLNLTWTDTNAVTHTTISMPMWDQKAAAMTNGLFNFNTALTTESASGSYIISTNGTIIQAATTYTACTTGTGTYNLKMTVEQLQ